MNKETAHLLYWWSEWLKRLVRTTYHLVNRRAYHQWKARRQTRSYPDYPDIEPGPWPIDHDDEEYF